MNLITNTKTLSTTKERADALAIVEAGLAAIDTVTAINNAVQIVGTTLRINDVSYELTDYANIYIIGFGKVSCAAAQTLEQLLKGRVAEGAVVGIAEKVCSVVDTYAGTHPLPSSLNYTATRHIADVARKATEDDLVLVIVSGGGSALLCSSMGECDQSKQLFTAFLPTGGTIEELNIVRKHLSSLKGGGLAKALYPAEVASLVFSDVPGGDLAAVASGPTYFDESTQADAQAIIDKYELGDFVLNETPKEKVYFERVTHIPLVTNETALRAMRKAAEELGYDARTLDTALYAEPSEVQALVEQYSTPGTAFCIGGETKLSIPGNCKGKGGRNDALALSMVDVLADGQLFLSVASDGRDNTEAAGALVDRQTQVKAATAGLTTQEYLDCYNSYPFFHTLGDHILTGPLESNVSDLMLILNRKVTQATTIESITATVLPDSRGRDTIEVRVTAGAYTGSFAVPSGASTGSREAVVLPAAAAVTMLKTEVAPALHGMSICDQAAIDAKLHELDGTDNFARIGGNLALGVSVAVLRAAAAASVLEPHEYIAELFDYHAQAQTPRLFINLINGGKHAIKGSVLQEHQIIPQTDDVKEALHVARRISLELYQQLVAAYGKPQVQEGDEGGYVIPVTNPHVSFAHLAAAIEAVAPEVPVALGADAAADSFCCNGTYTIDGTEYSATDLLSWYEALHEAFPALMYMEDPFYENDLTHFAQYRQRLPGARVIGDDLTTTNETTLRRVTAADAIDAVIIKPNQIGTISDTLAAMRFAYQDNIQCIVSHRSGETMDDFIADLAVGTRCYGFKAGAPSAPHRAVKYDRLRAILQ